jgi:hypothetical protein
LIAPKWIINFPTKEHCGGNSKMERIETRLEDLKRVVIQNKIWSIAVPAPGAGMVVSTGLMCDRRSKLPLVLLNDVKVIVYQPTDEYQDLSRRRKPSSST